MRSSTQHGEPLHVSVVTATYRRPEMLRTALRSVQEQSYPHFDVLVCDNANDPAAAAVVEELADDRFRYLGRQQNIGLFENAVDGLRRATGDLVFKLDDDDSLAPDCFRQLVEPFTQHPDVTLTFCDMAVVDQEDQVMPQYTRMYREEFGRAQLRPGRVQPFTAAAAECAILLACAMVRRDAVNWDAVPAEADSSYDLFVTLQAARDAASAFYIAQPLVNYRVHVGSDTKQQPVGQLEAAVFVLDHALGDPRQADREALRRALGNALFMLARAHLRQGQTAAARDALLRAMRLTPHPRLLPLIALAGIPSKAAAGVLGLRLDRYEQRLTGAA